MRRTAVRARSRSRDVEIGESKRRNLNYQGGKRKSTSKSASLRLMQKRLLLYIRRNRHQSTGLMIGLIIFVLIFISMSRHKNVVAINNQLSFESLDLSFDIIFKETRSKSVNIVSMPKSLGLILHDDDTEDEYGDLEIWLLEEDDARRNIWYDSRKYRTDYRLPDAEKDDDVDYYLAIDDDIQRDPKQHEPEEDGHCRRISEHRLIFPNCNSYHETPFIESHAKYLNAGAYRQVMVADHEYAGQSEKIILKDIHYDFEASADNYEFVRMDAIIAERLTASPRIYDIYAFCGLGIMSEFFPHGDMEKVAVPEEDAVPEKPYDPKNNLTPMEKLEVAKQMAEAMADLHGYNGGVMVHQDIQLSQFLWTADKSRIKLNDFNRAEFMLWDESKQEYCTYSEGRGMGTWRSPEEYYDLPLNERVDVFSFGNNLYSLLTGVYPFYDLQEEVEDIQDKVKHGVKPSIDPSYLEHSFAERKLIELIDWCYEYYPKDRPSIFAIVEFLENAIAEAKEKEKKLI